VAFLSRAETMGFLGEEDFDHLGLTTVRDVVDAMAEAGLGTSAGAVLHAPSEEISGSDVAEVLAELENILESSPAPDREWPALGDVFGNDTLAELLDVSVASVRRYVRGERATPDRVAARLHFLAMVVADLSGAYNDFGIRRWFTRSRNTLDGRAPGDLLSDGWDPDEAGPRRVRALARSLLGSGAT